MASRSITDLRMEFRPMVESWLSDCANAGLLILVYCTLRSGEEQDELYTHGRTAPGPVVTNAKAGESAHNYGLGLDHVPMLGTKPQWQAGNPYYKQSIALATARGLESLSDSPKFREWPHLQHPAWREIAKTLRV